LLKNQKKTFQNNPLTTKKTAFFRQLLCLRYQVKENQGKTTPKPNPQDTRSKPNRTSPFTGSQAHFSPSSMSTNTARGGAGSLYAILRGFSVYVVEKGGLTGERLALWLSFHFWKC